ncbi:MAG: 30S ribosome-binding factor RbfA [Candidatus Omnitrophica bacterium]|nr:30S ribosome-binding factor RbfA [Candidatus Omnitrophota bacterium]
MSRQEKVQEEIRKEISAIIQHEINDPRLGFVTITGVEVSKDLRYAKIFYSVLGQEADAKRTKEALDSAIGFIRATLAERIQLRFACEIVFKRDVSIQYGHRIEEIINQIKQQDAQKKEKGNEY